MTSDAASPTLRKLTEMVASELSHYNIPPQERYYDDFVLLALPIDYWAVGLRVEFSDEAWSVVEVLLLPSGPNSGFPPPISDGVKSYVDAAVGRGRDRQQAAAAQLKKLNGNANFVQDRFDAWRDKTSQKTNVEYAALAAKYAEQIRLGNSRATATLAKMAGMTPAVMAQRIKEARRRRLLTAGEKGKASGSLTPLGALLTDPKFPGFRILRRDGMTQREIAERYGISEFYVWHGILDGNGPDEYGNFPEGVNVMSADDLKRKYGLE